jgi:hypothetical protein
VNNQKLEKLLHACAAFSFGTSLLASVPPLAKADAADDWVRYRQANNLPVDPKPSVSCEKRAEGNVAKRTLVASLANTVQESSEEACEPVKACSDPFLVELARTDGDPKGEAGALCK